MTGKTIAAIRVACVLALAAVSGFAGLPAQGKEDAATAGDAKLEAKVEAVFSRMSQTDIVVKLQGFERVDLPKGQERTVTLRISTQQLASFRDDAWVIEPGEYEIRAAASATDIRLRGMIELTGGKLALKRRTFLIADQK